MPKPIHYLRAKHIVSVVVKFDSLVVIKFTIL